MDILLKTKYLSIIVLLLLVTNIAMISIFWYYNKPHKIEQQCDEKGNLNPIVNYFQKELSFDKNQTDSLRNIYSEYSSNVYKMKEKIRIFHNNINYQVINNKSADEIEADFKSLGDKKAELDKFSYQFFIDLRNLCNNEQKNKFDNLYKEIVKIINAKNQKR